MTAGVYLYLSRTFAGRAILAVSQDRLALRLMGADPIKIKQLAFGLSIATAALAGALLIVIGPVEPSMNRLVHRPGVRDRRAGRHGQHRRHAGRRFDPRRGGEPRRDLLRPLLGARGGLRHPAADPGVAAARPVRALEGAETRAGLVFWSALVLILLLGVLATKTVENEFFFFAGYAILQATIMAVAWNILGGFTGYVNFGSAGFFAIGAYTSVALVKALDPPIIVPLLVAAAARRPGRPRHRLPDAAAARRLLRDRDARHGDRVRDLRQQLGVCRRRHRRLHPDARDACCSSTATSSSCSR